MKIKEPLNVLVVEDDMGEFVLLEKHLLLTGLPVSNIFHARNKKEVERIQKALQFDLVLLDLNLPENSGVELMAQLNSAQPHIPVILLSGFSSVETSAETIALGAQNYLVKGDFDEQLLSNAIQYSIERKIMCDIIETDNEKYELVKKASHDTLWEWDYKTKSGVWGEGFTKIYGYPAAKKIYNKNWQDEYIHPEDRKRVMRKLKYYTAKRMHKWQDQYRFLDARGNYKIIFDRGVILYDREGHPKIMVGAMADITKRKKLEQELEKQRINQQKLITELTIQAQEKERNEIGRELHDNINQLLATVKLFVGMAKSRNEIPEEKEILGKSYEYITAAIEEIRQLSHSLVGPSLLEEGLTATLKKLTEEIMLTNGLAVRLDNKFKAPPAIDKKKELMIYRMVQEQISNIQKHAQAKNIDILLEEINHSLKLSISDDGIGFDAAQKTTGIGLRNIRSRVTFCNGDMNIISSPGKGCKLELTIPL